VRNTFTYRSNTNSHRPITVHLMPSTVLICHFNLTKKSNVIGRFQYRSVRVNDNLVVADFFESPCTTLDGRKIVHSLSRSARLMRYELVSNVVTDIHRPPKIRSYMLVKSATRLSHPYHWTIYLLLIKYVAPAASENVWCCRAVYIAHAALFHLLFQFRLILIFIAYFFFISYSVLRFQLF